MNKFVLVLFPFLIPIIFILSWLIKDSLVNIFPIRPIIIPASEIIIKNNIWKYTLTPVKKFWIDWTFIDKKDYSSRLWKEEHIISTDWLFSFWKLAKEEYLSNIDFTQSDRSYYYDLKTNIDIDMPYITTHMTTINILNNNNKISKWLALLTPNTNVKVFWYLVDIELTESDSYLNQKSSISMNDIGYWSTEILYITKLEINWEVYE